MIEADKLIDMCLKLTWDVRWVFESSEEYSNRALLL